MGGRLGGSVRSAAPADTKPSFEWRSPPLADVVRDINKFSNNPMAQQLFFTLDLQRHRASVATLAGARETLRRWLAERLGAPLPADWAIDNGSGLSRDTRLPARAARAAAGAGLGEPLAPELMASLPIAAVDGTLRRAQMPPGRAPEERIAFFRATWPASPATWWRRAAGAGCWWRCSTTRTRTPRGRRWTRSCTGSRDDTRALNRLRRQSGPCNCKTGSGYVAATLTTGSFLPQAWLTLRTRDVSGISLGMYSAFTLGVALWLAYGIALGEWPIIIANAFTVTLAAIILATKIAVERSRPAAGRR